MKLEQYHMNWIYPCLLLMIPVATSGQSVDPVVSLDAKTRPASIKAASLTEFDLIPNKRRALIGIALAVAAESPWLPYLAGGDTPSAGGFDCSGAMYYVLRKAGHNPPRSSGSQMEWLRKSGRLHQVPSAATDPSHASFAGLKPGDLLFWAVMEADNKVRVHHVEMYLGTEKMDGRPLMIGSADGRSYRGRKSNGYGVHDFKVPGMNSPSRLIAYGTPPDLDVE